MTAKNTSVSLGNHLIDFMQAQVRGGRYNSTSDVVRAGLRLLEERELEVAALHRSLREALIEGERSGPSAPFDFDDFVATSRKESMHRR